MDMKMILYIKYTLKLLKFQKNSNRKYSVYLQQWNFITNSI